MPRLNGRELVRLLLDGDPAGCRALVQLYQDRLVAEGVHVFRIEREDAEELVSDTLLAVIQRIHTFEFKRSDADFHFWVMAIFKNRVRDHFRRLALTKGMMVHFEETAGEIDIQMTQGEREVIKVIVRNYEESLRREEGEDEDAQPISGKLGAVREALEQLENWERVLLRCRAMEVPYEEIATYTGKSVNQLKVYHGRVKKKLIKLLGNSEIAALAEGAGVESR